jgi:hypothetical protein
LPSGLYATQKTMSECPRSFFIRCDSVQVTSYTKQIGEGESLISIFRIEMLHPQKNYKLASAYFGREKTNGNNRQTNP